MPTALKYNPVHTYVEGPSTLYGRISHLTYMSRSMTQHHPWMEGQWELSTALGAMTWHHTLEDAKAAAVKLWTDAKFKLNQQASDK